MYIIKNVTTNRPLVCTLGDKSTLRLFPGKEVTLTDKQCTDYIKSLVSLKILTLREVSDTKSAKKKPTAKAVENKDKEE